MKSSRLQRKFNHWMGLFLLLLVLISAIGALGVVWMRQQVAGAAYRVKSLEQSLIEVDRKTRSLDAKIAAAHHPQYLKSRVGVTLNPPNDHQIVWVSTEDLHPSKERLLRQPFNVSLDLAFMDASNAKKRYELD